jgi:hypothetical protein
MIAIEKLILLIIFLIVLVVLIILLFMSEESGNTLLLQNELRSCCQTYRANQCPDWAEASTISCNDDFFTDLIDKLNMNIDQAKRFCCCHICGNGICDCSESCSNCPQDCGSC